MLIGIVRRGQVLLDFDVLDGWDNELSQMNHGKVGEPYNCPDSFMQLLGYIVIALDSTGIKVSNRGEWMRHKWHVRKGYLKIHVAVDIKRKRIVSLEVTSEEVHDGMILNKLVNNASSSFAAGGNHIKGVLADGMYDSNKNFRYLSRNHIIPGIKTRSNSKVRSTDCHARNISVTKQQADFKRWKRSVSYGYRWMVETAFSSIKRMFGEHVTARKFPNMVKEIFLKATLYNIFNRIA